MPLVEAGGVKVNFPFDPYPCQTAYMEKVVECLKKGVNGILESPTGTGKTLCLLCSTLAWLEGKKAQIFNQKLKMTTDRSEDAVEFYKEQLVNQLDEAAGAWTGELAAPKVIYASRTHSQLTQAVQELKRTAYSHLKVCVLGSREQLCIHPQIMKESSNTTKVHLCRAKVSSRSCHFYNNVENGKGYFTKQVMDIEDLVTLGEKHKCCPYFMSKELKAEADVIFMPYNYLLDPKSRKAHQVELNGNIVIFDEAHNLEKMCEESASFDWTSADIASAIRDAKELSEKIAGMVEAEESGRNDMEFDNNSAQDFTLQDLLELKYQLLAIETFIDEIKIIKPEGDAKPGHFVFELFSHANVTFQNKNRLIELIDKIVTYLTSESTSIFHSKGSGLSKYADILKVVFSRDPYNEWTSVSSHQKTVSKHYKVFIKKNTPNPYQNKKSKVNWDAPAAEANKLGRTLSYWCFSPGHTMEELKSQGVKAIILTSGTLSPLDSFTTEMGIPFPVQLENPHVIEPHQVWIGIVGKGPDGTMLNSSYEHRFKESYQSSLGNAIVNFSRVVPHGLLLFFPSYPVMDKCLSHWQEKNIWTRIEQYKPVYTEPRTKAEFHTAMMNFYDTINDVKQNGAIFAAVCRGKVSEGLDFSDNNGRAVVITGLPFPPRMDPKVILKMQYLDEIIRNGGKGISGQAWYRQQASRAVNQAIGRVIRHKDDYGAIILCDNRFSSGEAKAQLPVWVRPYVKIYNQFGGALKDMMLFFKTVDKTMPAPKASKVRVAAGSGCEGAYFQPTLASSSKQNVASLSRSSAVVNHVPSLKPHPIGISEEKSLAKLKVEYEAADHPVPSQTQKKNLFEALSYKSGKDVFDFTTIGAQSKQTESAYQNIKPSQDRTKMKRKIIIKNSSGSTTTATSDVSRDSVQTAEQYLTEVKCMLSVESYCQFSRTLSEYKKSGDFDAMVACLADIFTDSQQKHHLFRKFYRFVRSHHKQKFDQTCKELLGEGCGYKPEDSISKRQLADTLGNGEKKRKITDSRNFPPTEMKSTDKTNPVSSLTQMKTVSSTKAGSSVSTSKCSTESSPLSGPIVTENSVDLKSSAESPLVPQSSAQSNDNTNAEQRLPLLSSGSKVNENYPSPSSDDIRKLMASKVSGYLCVLCKKNALIPLKAFCGHIGCFECWKQCLRNVKQCPTCKQTVKRKHLKRIDFPLPHNL